MQENLNKESKNKVITLLVIWGSMAMALVVYYIVAYMILVGRTMKFMKTPEFLNETLINGISYKVAALSASLIIFIGAYTYFKSAYKKLVLKVKNEEIFDIDERFKVFSQSYVTLMFVVLALYEMIAIMGIVLFLITGDINILSTLLLISFFGFLTLLPTKSKLTPRI